MIYVILALILLDNKDKNVTYVTNCTVPEL